MRVEYSDAVYYGEKFAVKFYLREIVFAVAEDLLPDEKELTAFYEKIYGRFGNNLVRLYSLSAEKRKENSIEIEGKVYCRIASIGVVRTDEQIAKIALVFLNFLIDFWEENSYMKYERHENLGFNMFCPKLENVLREIDSASLLVEGYKFESYTVFSPKYIKEFENEKTANSAIDYSSLYNALFESDFCAAVHTHSDECDGAHLFADGLTEIDYKRLSFDGLGLFYFYNVYGFYIDVFNHNGNVYLIGQNDCNLDDFWCSIDGTENEKIVKCCFFSSDDLTVFIKELDYMTRVKGADFEELRKWFYEQGNIDTISPLGFGCDKDVRQAADLMMYKKVRKHPNPKCQIIPANVEPYIAEAIAQNRQDLANDLLDFVIEGSLTETDFNVFVKAFFLSLESEIYLPFLVALSLEGA